VGIKLLHEVSSVVKKEFYSDLQLAKPSGQFAIIWLYHRINEMIYFIHIIIIIIINLFCSDILVNSTVRRD